MIHVLNDINIGGDYRLVKGHGKINQGRFSMQGRRKKDQNQNSF